VAAGFNDFDHFCDRLFRREAKRLQLRLHKCRNTCMRQSRKAIERDGNVASAGSFDACAAIGACRVGKRVEVYVDDRGIVSTVLMIVSGVALAVRRVM